MAEHEAEIETSPGVAGDVRAFYDRHPYPPPVDDLDHYRELWSDRERRRADFHLFWPTDSFREDRSVLVAGCGTSQAARYALRCPRARVIGIDISTTSMAATEALKQKYKLDNLELHVLPVERAGELAEHFGHVVATGVLHHLPDPDAGLRALRGVLAPGGAMHLMVYAPYGRAGVYLIQEYCRRLGIGSSAAEIRDLAESLSDLPPDHPLVPLLRDAPDFRSEAGLADALLHPQDRAYSVPQLFEFLARAGLQFGRWVRQAPYLPHCGGPGATPHRALLERLPANEQYAAIELFRGSMVRHNAIGYRGDLPVQAQPIRFDGEAWPEYVPLRAPDTICVEENLPPAANGVLINRAHTYTDIYLPIDAPEKQMFERIDGERTIREIAGAAGSPDRTRSLFERLWWYDQVVFDASRGG
jgi:SAM-dependent methyltransferase